MSDNGISIPYGDAKQEEMLVASARGDHVRLYHLIVDEAVSVSFRKKTESGDMTIVLAAVEGCRDQVLSMLIFLFDTGLIPCHIVDFRGRQGQCALYRACVIGYTAAVFALRAMGAQFLVRTDSGSTVLAAAAVPAESKTQTASDEICQIIIEHVAGLADGDSFVHESVAILESRGFAAQAESVLERYLRFSSALPMLEPIPGRHEVPEAAQRLMDGPVSMEEHSGAEPEASAHAEAR